MFKIGKNLVFKKNGDFNWTGVSTLVGGAGTHKEGVGKKSYLASVSGKDASNNRIVNLGTDIYLYSSFPAQYCQNGCVISDEVRIVLLLAFRIIDISRLSLLARMEG